MGFLTLNLHPSSASDLTVSAADLPVKFSDDKGSTVPAFAKAKAHEKLLFLQKVVTYAREMFVGEQAAASVLAMRANEFQILSTAGKGGSSALNYSSFRNWIKLTGRRKDKMPNADKLAALIENYYNREVTQPGDEAFWIFFFRCYANTQKRKLAGAYREAHFICKTHGIHEIPSETQVRYYLKHHFSEAALKYAREGENWAQDRLFSFIHRDWSSVKPGEVWIGDHHKLDVYAQVTDPKTGKIKVIRPWLTAWMDAKSLYFVGVELSAEAPNTVSILRALAAGYCVNNWRGPQMLYSDNGADFKRKGFALPVEFEGAKHSICQSLGIQPTFALPYNGRAKPIERVFKEIAENFCRRQKTYLGNVVGARPAEASFYEKYPQDAPTLEEIQEGLTDYIYNTYHKKIQNAGKILGVNTDDEPRCPAEVWAERSEFGPAWTPQQLKEAMLFPIDRSRLVGQGWNIRILHNDYRAQKMGDQLNMFHGKNVMIKQDLFLGGYAAYELNGRPIVPLETVPGIRAIGASLDDAESAKLAAEIAHARRQKRWVKNVLRSATGLPVLVCADDAMKLMEHGAKLELTGEKMSVKGTSHKFQNYKVVLPDARVEETVEEVQLLPPPLPEQLTENQPNMELVAKLAELKRAKRADY